MIDKLSKELTSEHSPFSVNRFLQIKIATRDALLSRYLPFVANGGLFIPDTVLPELQRCVFLLLELEFLRESHAVTGRVVLLNPVAGSVPGLCQQGFGVQFEEGAQALLEIIENQQALATETA